jgi:hypothetical protein
VDQGIWVAGCRLYGSGYLNTMVDQMPDVLPFENKIVCHLCLHTDFAP